MIHPYTFPSFIALEYKGTFKHGFYRPVRCGLVWYRSGWWYSDRDAEMPETVLLERYHDRSKRDSQSHAQEIGRCYAEALGLEFRPIVMRYHRATHGRRINRYTAMDAIDEMQAHPMSARFPNWAEHRELPSFHPWFAEMDAAMKHERIMRELDKEPLF